MNTCEQKFLFVKRNIYPHLFGILKPKRSLNQLVFSFILTTLHCYPHFFCFPAGQMMPYRTTSLLDTQWQRRLILVILFIINAQNQVHLQQICDVILATFPYKNNTGIFTVNSRGTKKECKIMYKSEITFSLTLEFFFMLCYVYASVCACP